MRHSHFVKVSFPPRFSDSINTKSVPLAFGFLSRCSEHQLVNWKTGNHLQNVKNLNLIIDNRLNQLCVKNSYFKLREVRRICKQKSPLNHWNIENYSYISILALSQYDQIFIDKQLSFVSLGQKYIKFLSYDQFTTENLVQLNQKLIRKTERLNFSQGSSNH